MPVGIADRLEIPGRAAVRGCEVAAVRSDGNAVLGIREPDVEEWRLVLGRPMHALPGHASVLRPQDHRVMPHHPAEVAVVKVNAGEGCPCRHLGLLPRLTAVRRDDDVAAMAHRYQRTVDGNGVQLQRSSGQRRLDRILGRLFVLRWCLTGGADDEDHPDCDESPPN